MVEAGFADDLSAIDRFSARLIDNAPLNRRTQPRFGLLESLADELRACDSLEDRWQSVVSQFAQVGADQLNYGVFTNPELDRSAAPVQFLSTMSSDWLDYYSSERLDQHELHAAVARAGLLRPYQWGASGLDLLTGSARCASQELTAEAGLRSGLHIPLVDPLDPELPAGSFTIGSSLSEAEFFAAIAGREGELIAAAQLFHMFGLAEMRGRELPGAPLTVRERDCLALVAEGMRIDQLAERLGLSRPTIEMHLRNARKKLGATTLASAVAKGLVSGQI